MQCYDYILNWLAHAVQRPHIKINALLALYSKEEQACKNVFVNTLIDWIFGRDLAINTADFNDIFGKNGASTSQKLLVCFNDATFYNDKDISNKIKRLMAEHDPTVEQKIKNYSNYIICANNEQLLHLGADNKKIVIVPISTCKIDDSQYLNNYVNNVNTLAGSTDVYNYLMHRNIEDWMPADIPEIAILSKTSTLDTFEQWCCAVRDNQVTIAATTHLDKLNPRTPVMLLHDSYTLWLKTCDQYTIRNNNIKNIHQMADKLVKIGYNIEKRTAGTKHPILCIENFSTFHISKLADEVSPVSLLVYTQS
jgi:hypothetical protein